MSTDDGNPLVAGLEVRIGVETVKVSLEGSFFGVMETLVRLPQAAQQLEDLWREANAKMNALGRPSYEQAVDYLIDSIRKRLFTLPPPPEKSSTRRRRVRRRAEVKPTPPTADQQAS